jgi:hypothetical protein
MIKIGLVGENPNDTTAIANLLKQQTAYHFHFFTMLNDVNGDDLDSDRALSLIRTEYQFNRPDLVVYIRDLDALETDTEKIQRRKELFQKKRRRVNGRAILLLIVFESEALVLADVDGFLNYLIGQQLRRTPAFSSEERAAFINEKRNLLSHVSDPMLERNPKETLIERFGYDESKLAKIAEHLKLETVVQNHRGFALFLKRFLKKIDQLKKQG